MTTATKPVQNRIAVLFDFDDTLAPDSFRSLLEELGLDKATFERERIQPLVDDGWDKILAKFHCLIQESHDRDDKITRNRLLELGRKIQFFDGVPEMFDRLRQCARERVDNIEVDFYLLSSGFLEIVQGTPIADEFKAMYGCTFYFNDNGEIAFVKRIITHPEKVRYILQVSKGVSEQGEEGSPADVYRYVPDEELRVPLDQIIYVGDGTSDMPVFRLLNEGHGVAIGVFKGESADGWDGFDSMDKGRRVQNLARVDYSRDSELMKSLTLAVESMCARIALQQLSKDE